MDNKETALAKEKAAQINKKEQIFLLMHNSIKNQRCSARMYKVLLLVDFCQLLYFSIHPKFDTFLWDSPAFQYFREVV
jgi:hypothetical protein